MNLYKPRIFQSAKYVRPTSHFNLSIFPSYQRNRHDAHCKTYIRKIAPEKVPVLSTDAPAPSPLMSQAIICNGMVYCSGSLGIDSKTGKFVEGDASNQTIQALRNLESVLKSAGSDLSKAVKVNIFISSMDHYAKVNEGYGEIFTHDVKPCRTCVAVAELPLKAAVEIELVAYL